MYIITVRVVFAALQIAINLPSTSLCCLGALIHHLKAFKLQKVLTITRFVISALHPANVYAVLLLKIWPF